MTSPNTIEVTIDNKKPPNFSFHPNDLTVKGKAHVKWTQGQHSAKFTFVAIAFHEPNPIGNIVVAEDINATADNSDDKVHRYSVLVKVDGTIYSSPIHQDGSGPTIRNK
jgi:hypothetical protein